MVEITMIELRDTLAYLYDEKEGAKATVEFSSLDTGWINFDTSPKAMWDNILMEAMKHEAGVAKILENVISDYPDNEVVQSAMKYGIEYNKSGTKKEKKGPFEEIIKLINKDSFGEIRRVDCNRSEQIKTYYKGMDPSCTITYAIGKSKDMPHSFAERIMLQTLEYSKDIDSGKHNCWLYRKPDGDRRVDEIPFDILPNIELSKKQFCKRMESLFEGLNMDKAKEYFARHQFRNFAFSIKYNYGLGDEMLEDFTAWIHETFSGIEETSFQIFFIVLGFRDIEKVEKHMEEIKKSLGSVPIIPLKIFDPVFDIDIDAWKGQVNLGSYSDHDFINHLSFLKIPEEEIAGFKETKKLTMQSMEKFQSTLYDAFIKSKK
ncbi:MAG: effector-associated domain EAD1-containing protein [Saprospiraceae bacterium]|nr:effector-associated domain EAD1-containing protein [Saprospiraceae bacterium]